MVLTKLDGSAKGGIVFAVETELGIPVKLVGIGETIGDLVPFDPDEFVDALFEVSTSLARCARSVRSSWSSGCAAPSAGGGQQAGLRR